ncbi:MAG: DUF4168 domain-containing protein [Alphaproteobacteria bacterium]|nr:MAG: DUF4168 domain-containing protein [Alphaproteobacteria bacterium]
MRPFTRWFPATVPSRQKRTSSMPTLRRSLGLLAALAFVFVAGAAIAQDAAPTAAPAFSEAKLDAFANAAVSVSRVMNDWRSKVQTAQSEEEKTAMIEQANQDIEAAIKATDGITLDEYEAIAGAAQKDAAFAEALKTRVLAKLRAASAPPKN